MVVDILYDIIIAKRGKLILRQKDMDYIIFDLEWNQPPVENEIVTHPVFLTGEIIEIGAVKLNECFEQVDELRLYIKPQYYTKMHHRVASLTGIHDRDLQRKGHPFTEAFVQFQQWCGENFAYMTWSMSDLPVLVDNMLLHGIDTSDLPVCYDIQRIFGREIMRSTTRYSLDMAISILSEPGDTAHDALHDARNTARVCTHLDLDTFLDEYGAKVFLMEPYCKVYECRENVLTDTDLTSFSCPWCEEAIQCENWVPWGTRSVAAVASCDEGDEFFVQITYSRHHTGAYYAKRLIYEMSDDLWELYQEAKQICHAK